VACAYLHGITRICARNNIAHQTGAYGISMLAHIIAQRLRLSIISESTSPARAAARHQQLSNSSENKARNIGSVT